MQNGLLQQNLRLLCETPGVAGDEGEAAAVAASLLSSLGEVSHTPLGSVLCKLPCAEQGLPKIMLTAHLDSVGLMVTRITKQGFVSASACGSPDRRSLSGARVTLFPTGEDQTPLTGVIVATPPHLSDGKAIPPKSDAIAIDIGMGEEAARKLLRHGDRIVLAAPYTELLSDRIAAPFLDNRAGCAAVIEAARQLGDCKQAEISVALVSQEEVGSAGAVTAAYQLAPDYAFVVDVSMGLTPDDRVEHCGELGKGPMIGYAPILDRSLSQRMATLSKELDIPCQAEVMGGRTGTDADSIAVSGKGVKTALLSIPLRFMHTAGEIVSLRDVADTARLIALTIKEGF